MKFGDKLKNLREENNMSRDELANKLNISYSAVSKYETSVRFPDQEMLKKISDTFNVSIDYLLGRTDVKNPYKDKPPLPEEFTSPEEAVKFILNQNVIMGFGGFDVNTLSDDEVVEFANELLNQLRILSYKYKK